jgi:hypothetical protein
MKTSVGMLNAIPAAVRKQCTNGPEDLVNNLIDLLREEKC